MKPAPGKRMTLALKAVQEASSEPVYRRGIQYYRRKKVLKYEETGSGEKVEALVIGSEPQPYRVTVQVDEPEVFKAECSCPYFEEVCKHSVAVLLTYIARRQPGIRFDLNEPERPRELTEERVPKARDLLDDPKDALVEEAAAQFTLGVLVLEKPLALILGTMPDERHGKVNILKIPPQILDLLPPESRIWRLTRYLTLLPQTTKGPAGGHRVPRGDEGAVIGHISLCAQLVNTNDGSQISFAGVAAKPIVVISETESGELLLKLVAQRDDGQVLPDSIFFLGQSCWVLSHSVFYSIDVSALHRLFPFFDSHGEMTVKLDLVPKFLAVDLPILKKRLPVKLDETVAPFPVAVTEPPKVVIRLAEKKDGLELALGFAYGELVLPSRDETSAVESELYTRTISDSGQSVWVKRMWELESQVRRFLSNLLPMRTIADRFFFLEEPALDVVYYLSSEQCNQWDVTGLQELATFRVREEPLNLTAGLTLKKNAYKFDFDLTACSNGDSVPFEQIVDSVCHNKNYIKLSNNEFCRLPVQTLLSLLKVVGQSKEIPGKERGRPLFQALHVAAALEAHGINTVADEGFHEFLTKLRNFKELTPIEVHTDFRGALREYQKEGFHWLYFLREYGLSGILADDMGLGKTIQALAILLAHHKDGQKRLPSLVVAPTSVVYNWMTEAQRFTPTLKTELFLGRERGELLSKLGRDSKGKPDVLFTTYGIIRRDYEALKNIPFEFVILDEAQNIKNPDSVGAKACRQLNALHRLALTGTPVENRLKELWSIFDFLMPEFLGTYRDFNDTFERPIESGIEGVGQKLRKIAHPFILRRMKSQVERELPDRTDIINLCELDDEQRSLYLDVLDECRQKIFGEIASRGIGRSQISVLAALLRLRQVCCDPRLLKNRGDSKLPESAKLFALLEMIDELVEEGHKVLVFSQFVEMLTLIRNELDKTTYSYEYLDGQTPAKDRLDKVNRFNADDSIPIFLISLKAGGTGLNLTGADYVIHYDPWWNPAVENQATDRAHRIGQTRHVFNYKLITKGTVEEKILALQKKKKELAELVIGGDEGVAKELTQEDLEFLFSF